MAGWIKLHRDITNHWLWRDEPYTKGQAWIDLLLWARHKPGKIALNGELVLLDVGQQARSERTLSMTWRWSRGKVRRFLMMLEGDQMLVQLTVQRTKIITICNYRDYQDGEKEGSTNDGTNDGPPTVPMTDHRRTTDGTNDGPPTVPMTVHDRRRVRREEGKEGEKGKKGEEQTPVEHRDEPGTLATDDAADIFDYWLRVMTKTAKAKLTDKRRACIQARLREGYDVDLIKQAIDGCAKSPHHMGQNDAGTKYDDLTLICRTGDKLEWFAQSVAAVTPQRPGEQTIEQFEARVHAQVERTKHLIEE